MKQPPSFNNGNDNIVCKLYKALYGLKQAPHGWFQKLGSTLHRLGFEETKSGTSFFTLRTRIYNIHVSVCR
uniref:Reverse transcriptase Ty1/copia-type domain-containing protein n=1 Tax=Cajanus cajan TaxID=3821 RepID=A0A151TZ79_CAJCA|nr:hypothetical protein KK1_004935 [Cajanus cajan]